MRAKGKGRAKQANSRLLHIGVPTRREFLLLVHVHRVTEPLPELGVAHAGHCVVWEEGV